MSKLHDQVSYVHSGRCDILWPQASTSWLWSLARTWQLRTLFQCSVVLWKTWMKSESVLWNILQIFSRYFVIHVDCCCVIVSHLHSPFLCITGYILRLSAVGLLWGPFISCAYLHSCQKFKFIVYLLLSSWMDPDRPGSPFWGTVAATLQYARSQHSIRRASLLVSWLQFLQKA